MAARRKRLTTTNTAYRLLFRKIHRLGIGDKNKGKNGDKGDDPEKAAGMPGSFGDSEKKAL